MKKHLLSIYLNLIEFFSKFKIKQKYPAKLIHYFLVKHFFKFPVSKIRKKILFVHRKDSFISPRILWCHSYEDFLTDFIKTKINKGDIVLDIGANIGYYSVLFSEWVGKKGKVFAFEPDLDNFNLLRKNININNCKNVLIVNKALSSERGYANLFLNPINKGDHRLWPIESDRNYVKVETATLDDYLNKYLDKVDFIKMDVQGAEAKVVKGAEILLKKSKYLKGVAEFWPLGLIKCGNSPEEFLEMLTISGFKIYNMSKKEGIKLVSKEELLQKYKPEKPGEKEVFASIFFTKEILK